MGCDEEEGSAKKGEADSDCPFGLDLWDDPGCDCGVLHLCVGGINGDSHTVIEVYILD